MAIMVAQAAWWVGCLPEYVRFRRALGRVREEQAAILARIVGANRDCEFGRRHGFGDIRSVEDYRARVPVVTHEDVRADIERLALTRERVRLFEPTSGSTTASKLIPYTASLEREFQRGIRPWIADLYLRDPELMRGPAYWSVSPPGLGTGRTAAGIPIGFADDSEYAGRWQKHLVQAVMAVPPGIRRITDPEEFWRATVERLRACRELRLISVWSPSFLSILADRLEDDPARVWPKLRLISCWADAHSSGPARALMARFPQARLQPKGLIATEGFVSLPFRGRTVLAVRSHFFEFLPKGDASAVKLAHELDLGAVYSVVLTTGGGLYRYALGDLVEVTGREQEAPVLSFIGRDRVSDRRGEKLHEAHVSRVVAEAFAVVGVHPEFATLACEGERGYVLYYDADCAGEVLAAEVERGLGENVHYAHARRLGQLAAVTARRVEGAAVRYQKACEARGQRAGDVKTPALDLGGEWGGEEANRMPLRRFPSGD